MSWDAEQFQACWLGRMPRLMDAPHGYAVLAPLVKTEEGLSLLYEVRADTLGRQPGETCFPGGRMETGETVEQCALRETEEELNIPRSSVRVLGQTDFIYHQAGFMLYPVLGEVSGEGFAGLRASSAEVKRTFTVPVDWLREHPPELYHYSLTPNVSEDFPYEAIGFPKGYGWRGGHVDVPVYRRNGEIIWGMTARITRHIISVMEERYS